MTHEFNTLHDLMVWMKEEVREKGLAYYQVCDLTTDFMHLVGDTEELRKEFGENYEAEWYWAIRKDGTGLFGWSTKYNEYVVRFAESVLGQYTIHCNRDGQFIDIVK